MGTPRASRHVVLLLIVLALVATACRSGQDEDVAEGGGDPLATDAPTSEPESETETASETGSEPTSTGTGAAGSIEDITFDTGVTAEPCPDGNPDRGCIYLGSLSDLTEGPFAALGNSIVAAQEAFWNRVNEEGGIGGLFDVNVTEFVRDNKYNPQVTTQVYQEIKPEVLGLAQTLGSPPTSAIIEDLVSSNVVSVPATWTSDWLFRDVIVESGNVYCVEAANGVDYGVAELGIAGPVMAVHYPGEYGEDGAAGVKLAAEAAGLEFINVETAVGPENQTGAISQIVQANPALVYVTASPPDLAAIVGGATAQGYQGQFMGQSPSFSAALMATPVAEALAASYIATGPWDTFTSDTPGHQAMREALGDVTPDDGYTSGWAWSYPMVAVLETAVELGDLTREGMIAAVQQTENADYEGMLPEEAGNFAGEPAEMAVRGTIISEVTPESETGLRNLNDGFYTGTTVETITFEDACFRTVDLDA